MNQDDWDNFSESSSDGGYRSKSPQSRGSRRSPSPEYERRDYGGGRRGGRGGYNRERRPPRNVSKGRILEQAEMAMPCDSIWLNLFELDRNAGKEEILDFFSSVPALNADWHRSGKNSMDVEFKSLEDLSKAIDLC